MKVDIKFSGGTVGQVDFGADRVIAGQVISEWIAHGRIPPIEWSDLPESEITDRFDPNGTPDIESMEITL